MSIAEPWQNEPWPRFEYYADLFETQLSLHFIPEHGNMVNRLSKDAPDHRAPWLEDNPRILCRKVGLS